MISFSRVLHKLNNNYFIRSKEKFCPQKLVINQI
jgi:hypothetical protein